MERFRVTFNGQSQTIGVPEPGVLSVIVCAVVREKETPGPERECELTLGGLQSAAGVHVKWPKHDLRIGDRIVIEVLEEGSFDPPVPEYLDYSEMAAESKRDYVRRTAAELGWTIIEGDTSPET